MKGFERLLVYLVAAVSISLLENVEAFSSTVQTGNTLLILGFGRCGEHVAKQALALQVFQKIYGTTRTAPSLSSLNVDFDEIERVMFDAQALRPILADCSHVLLTLPPPLDEDATAVRVWECLKECLKPQSWIGIISTTSVYGNHDGDWVTEESECKGNPNYLAWESQWKDIALTANHTCRIFRCAGIYSEDRSALHTVFRKGLPSSRETTSTSSSSSKSSSSSATPAMSLTSRIHVSDIASAIVASMMQQQSSTDHPQLRIYNLADDLPESRQVVLEYAADLLKSVAGISVRPPEHADDKATKREPSKRTQRRVKDKKRVDNTRMKTELLPDMTFPTYKEGLNEIVRDRSNPWWSS